MTAVRLDPGWARYRVEHTVTDRPTAGDYTAFLRDAGFAEAGTVWQYGDDRLVVGIR